MKVFQKIRIMLLCTVLLFAGMPMHAFQMTAEAADIPLLGQCGENVFYSFNEVAGLLTISGTGDMYNSPDVNFPFADNDAVQAVINEKGVTSIGSNAFSDCVNLTSVSIADSVTSIGDWAFFCCINLTTVVIPKNVSYLGEGAFHTCQKLTAISIPNQVTTIGDYTFVNCYGITVVTIPTSVTAICEKAFCNCTSLKYVTIPDSVTRINYDAFYYSDSISDVYFGGTPTQWEEAIIGGELEGLTNATIHYNSSLSQTTPPADNSLPGFSAQYPNGTFSQEVSLLVTQSEHTDLPAMGITVKEDAGTTEYNICVVNSAGEVVQPQNGQTVTLRLPIPEAYKGRDASQYSIYHYIESSQGKLERFTVKKGNLRVFADYLEIDVGHFSAFVLVVEPVPVLNIHANPGRIKLHFGETVVLHAEAENLPEDASIVWTADANDIVSLKPSADGRTCNVTSAKTGTVRVTVKLVDADGGELHSDGNPSESVQSKAGLF